MTPVQQTALDFCREVLDCGDARLVDGHVCSRSGDLAIFRHDDLNVVLNAARWWCDQHGYGIEMHFNTERWFTCVDIVRHTEEMGNYGDASDPCHALMLSCVAANRKLKGISHD